MKLVTIRSYFANELTIKKSRFIASIHPVLSENSVKETLAKIKQEHRNATHYPHAYRIGFEKISERCSDDGEPPKSSGLPILKELQNAHLTNVMLTVTRYFGGTQLGLGGLSRAYRESAVNVIMVAHKILSIPTHRLKLAFQQEIAGKIRNLLHRFNAQIVEETYGESTTYIIEIEKDRCDACTEAVNNLTKGKATITLIQLIEKE